MSPTLEALVDSRWEGVSQHHHRGVDDDFSAPALRSCHLALTSATIQFQHHFVVMAIKEDLVPFAVVEAIFGQGEIVVPIADVVGDAEKTLQNLQRTLPMSSRKGIKTDNIPDITDIKTD